MWTLDNMWIARALFTACVKKTPCSWKQCSYCKDVGLPARTQTSWLNLRPGFHNNITLYTVRHVLLKRRINESEAVSHNSTAPKHLNHAMNPWPNKRDNPAKPSGCIQKRKVSDLAAQTETCRSPLGQTCSSCCSRPRRDIKLPPTPAYEAFPDLEQTQQDVASNMHCKANSTPGSFCAHAHQIERFGSRLPWPYASAQDHSKRNGIVPTHASTLSAMSSVVYGWKGVTWYTHPFPHRTVETWAPDEKEDAMTYKHSKRGPPQRKAELAVLTSDKVMVRYYGVLL
jgi:hypothetical protein